MARGGGRQGAGRKKFPKGTTKVPLSVRVYPDLLEWARSQPEGITALIEDLIRQARAERSNQ